MDVIDPPVEPDLVGTIYPGEGIQVPIAIHVP
jgi:hypothetical protein